MSDIAAANAALISDLQSQFKEILMLASLGDQRRRAEQVTRAANQPGSPARPLSEAVQAVSPVGAGGLSSPRKSMGEAALSGSASTSPSKKVCALLHLLQMCTCHCARLANFRFTH